MESREFAIRVTDFAYSSFQLIVLLLQLFCMLSALDVFLVFICCSLGKIECEVCTSISLFQK